MTIKQPAIPNLKGKVLKEHVKTIGTGRYAAEYAPWSRIAELLNENAPGWFPELVHAPDGDVLWKAPVGAYLMIRFVHIDGTTTPAYPQAVMDNRHQSIPFDKITSRDVSDTQRRGFCLAAAACFNLGVELWTRDECEAGFSRMFDEGEDAHVATPAVAVTSQDFLEAALAKGLSTHAAEDLASKLKGNFAGGIARLAEKDDKWVSEYNSNCAPKEASAATDGSQW